MNTLLGVRQLLRQRLQTLGVTMTDASRYLNRNQTYIQQFIARGIPQALDEADRVALSEMLGVDAEQLRSSRPRRAYRTAPVVLTPGPALTFVVGKYKITIQIEEDDRRSKQPVAQRDHQEGHQGQADEKG